MQITNKFVVIYSNFSTSMPAPPAANFYPQTNNTTTVSSTSTVPTATASPTTAARPSEEADGEEKKPTLKKAKDSSAGRSCKTYV